VPPIARGGERKLSRTIRIVLPPVTERLGWGSPLKNSAAQILLSD